MDTSLEVHDVRKIAVLRTGALGDLIVTLPAFEALRESYPEAEIVLLGLPWHRKFVVPGRTPVDRVVVVPVTRGIRAEHQLTDGYEPDPEAFFRAMRKEKFDLAISFQGNGISANPFMRKLGARVMAGTWCPGAEKPDRYLTYCYYQHEVMRYLEIAGLVGASTKQTEPRLVVLPRDREEMRQIPLPEGNRPYVLLNPVAADFRRMWPLENYAHVADTLEKRGLDIIFTGSVKDYAAVSDIIHQMHAVATNACGISLGGLCALASEARAMISPDTGPLHLARAVNCPTVGIFWAPNLINWGPASRQLHRPVISWRMECPLCGMIPNDPYPFEPLTACGHEVSFVRDITPAQVEHAALGLPGIAGKIEGVEMTAAGNEWIDK